MKQLRGFKYRFYPNSAQRLELGQTFGCTRFVYNWALAFRTNSYYEEQKSLTYTDTSNALTKLKKDPGKTWLKQVSSVPLQQGLRNLNKAFEAFFQGRTKYPRFKKKSGKQSATYAANAFVWKEGKLTLAKMKQPLKIRWSRNFQGEPKTVTVSQERHGRYFVSFLVEEELDRWFPSSKRCSSCGYLLNKLPLSVRKWTCPQDSCRTTHLRDVNAAKNILAVGQTVIACGDTSGGEMDLTSLAMCQ